jgi:hypothetical protein
MDDINLLSDSIEHMQSMLNTCFTWSRSSTLLFNIRKCFDLANESTPRLKLGDDPIQTVDECKYLGVPFNTHGANWINHGEDQLNKAEQMMNYLCLISRPCTPGLRIRLYKTYCLPILVYCAPCVDITTTLVDDGDRWYIEDRWKQHNRKALQFIYNRDVPKAKIILNSMVQLLPFQTHIQYITASSIFHLQKIPHTTHPWLSLSVNRMRLDNQLPDSVYTKINRPHKHYCSFIKSRTQNPTLTWKQYCVEEQTKILNRPTTSLLPWYILENARDAPNKPDKFLYHPSTKIRHAGLLIRTTAVWCFSKCFVCGKAFNRKHINECNYQNYIPQSIMTDDILQKQEDYHQWLQQNTRQWQNYRGHFTIFDCLLNEQRYEDFQKAFTAIDELMGSVNTNSNDHSHATDQDDVDSI